RGVTTRFSRILLLLWRASSPSGMQKPSLSKRCHRCRPRSCVRAARRHRHHHHQGVCKALARRDRPFWQKNKNKNKQKQNKTKQNNKTTQNNTKDTVLLKH